MAGCPRPPPEAAAKGKKVAAKASEFPRVADKDLLPILQESCFAAGTPIRTPFGSQPIETLGVGDLVLTRPEDDPSAPIRARRVEALFELEAVIVDLTVGGRVIHTTAEHPFFVDGQGWKQAQQLEPGDPVLGHDGRATPVTAVKPAGRSATVYNLRVSEFHTYFVGAEDWGFSVWAHNTCEIVRKFEGPIHHIASDKSSRFTAQFQALFDRAGLSMQSAWNRMRVPGHVGPHGSFYNELVLRRLSTAVEGTSGAAYRSALIGELKALRWDIRYGGLGDLLKAAASRVDRLRLY